MLRVFEPTQLTTTHLSSVQRGFGLCGGSRAANRRSGWDNEWPPIRRGEHVGDSNLDSALEPWAVSGADAPNDGSRASGSGPRRRRRPRRPVDEIVIDGGAW